MKRINKITYLVMLLLVVSVMFSGCGKTEPNTKYNVSIVWGRHSNAYKLNIQDVKKYVKDASESYGYVSLIELDGNPFMLDSYDIPELKSGLMGLSEKNIEKKLSGYCKKIYQTLENCKPEEEEVDVMTAIKLAKTSLDSVDEGERIIVINDSGVSTKGVVDFTDSILDNIDADEVVSNLKQTESLIDLKGYKVIWLGLGNVSSPQKELSEHNIKMLMNVWESILKEEGAETEFIMTVPSRETEEKLPNVSTVDVFEPVNSVSKTEFDENTIFEVEKINFKADTNEITNSEESVIEQLSGITSYLKEHPEDEILIAGTTASAGEQDTAVLLSKSRCETIKKLMLKKGVSDNQIATIGLGYKNHPFHITDVDENGTLIEDKAQKNRKVIILHKDSDMAKKILKY